MSQELLYRAKKELRLDCGDTAKAGDEFVVIKTFVCQAHARSGASKSDAPERKPEQAPQK